MTHKMKIDGVPIVFSEGQTIMDAAIEAGIYIPHLCHHPDYTPHGSCRLCIVNLNGRQVTSCTTKAQDGYEIDNNSDALMEQRRLLLKLLFIEGNHVCPACEKSGACTLQAVAYHCEMLAPELKHFYPVRGVDASHSTVIIDFNRCIACGLCVKASKEKDYKHVFSLAGRGLKTHVIINSASGKLVDSALEEDDIAANICPVGAILPKNRAYEVPIGQRLYDQVSINKRFKQDVNDES